MKITIKTLIVAAFCLSMSPLVTAQSATDINRVKAYYFAAEDALDARQYDDAISALDKAKSLRGATDARATSIRVKSLVGKQDYIKAKRELDKFYDLNPSNELQREMSSVLLAVDERLSVLASVDSYALGQTYAKRFLVDVESILREQFAGRRSSKSFEDIRREPDYEHGVKLSDFRILSVGNINVKDWSAMNFEIDLSFVVRGFNREKFTYSGWETTPDNSWTYRKRVEHAISGNLLNITLVKGKITLNTSIEKSGVSVPWNVGLWNRKRAGDFIGNFLSSSGIENFTVQLTESERLGLEKNSEKFQAGIMTGLAH